MKTKPIGVALATTFSVLLIATSNPTTATAAPVTDVTHTSERVLPETTRHDILREARLASDLAAPQRDIPGDDGGAGTPKECLHGDAQVASTKMPTPTTQKKVIHRVNQGPQKDTVTLGAGWGGNPLILNVGSKDARAVRANCYFVQSYRTEKVGDKTQVRVIRSEWQVYDGRRDLGGGIAWQFKEAWNVNVNYGFWVYAFNRNFSDSDRYNIFMPNPSPKTDNKTLVFACKFQAYAETYLYTSAKVFEIVGAIPGLSNTGIGKGLGLIGGGQEWFLKNLNIKPVLEYPEFSDEVAEALKAAGYTGDLLDKVIVYGEVQNERTGKIQKYALTAENIKKGLVWVGPATNAYELGAFLPGVRDQINNNCK